MSDRSRPNYPICLIPRSLLEADPDRGELPKPPSVLSFASLFSLGLGLGTLALLLASVSVGSPVEPWLWLIPIGAVGFAGWESWTRWQLRQQRLRMQRERQQRRSALLADPNELSQWRLRRLQTLLRVASPMLSQSEDPQGLYDLTLYRALQGLEGVEVMRQQRVNGTFTPDVIVRVPQLNLWIDAEVDDPWFNDREKQQRVPRHCIGQDDFRNQYFLERNWIVVRFAEEQVASNPRGCVKEIARVIDRLYPAGRLLDQVQEVEDLQPVAAWTEQEALQIPRYFDRADRRSRR